MPRLLLLRHAKAENSGKGGAGDHERALSEQGRRDAAAIGRLVASRGESIDLVLCSTSLRTRETWDLVGAALPALSEVRFLREIYSAEDSYLPILRSEPGEAHCVLLVGHNPAIQHTAVTLVSGSRNTSGSGFAAVFPTAAVAIVEWQGSWGDLRTGAAQPVAFLGPEDA